jgi:hypothetical protein
LRLGGASGCLIALRLSPLTGGLRAPDFRLEARDQLALGVSLDTSSQFPLLDSLAQRGQFSLGFRGAPARRLKVTLGFLTGGLLAPGVGIQPCDQIALGVRLGARGQLALRNGLAQGLQPPLGFSRTPIRLLAARLGRAPGSIQTCGQRALNFDLLTRGFHALSRLDFAVCGQLALLEGLAQGRQLPLGLRGNAGCIGALRLGLAPGGLLARGFRLQTRDPLALRLDLAARGRFTLFCGSSQRCQLSSGLGGALLCRRALGRIFG